MDYLFPGRSLHLRSVSQGEAVSFLLDLIWGTRSDVWAKTKTCTIKSTYFFKKKLSCLTMENLPLKAAKYA